VDSLDFPKFFLPPISGNSPPSGQRQVSAGIHNLDSHVEVSSRTDFGVEECFEKAIQLVLSKEDVNMGRIPWLKSFFVN